MNSQPKSSRSMDTHKESSNYLLVATLPPHSLSSLSPVFPPPSPTTPARGPTQACQHEVRYHPLEEVAEGRGDGAVRAGVRVAGLGARGEVHQQEDRGGHLIQEVKVPQGEIQYASLVGTVDSVWWFSFLSRCLSLLQWNPLLRTLSTSKNSLIWFQRLFLYLKLC